MLVLAINELATGDVIGNLLSLSDLPGQGPLACRHHLERESIIIMELDDDVFLLSYLLKPWLYHK